MPDRQHRTKTATINLRVDAEVKALAERAAAADRRSLTSYIEKLIEDDARARFPAGAKPRPRTAKPRKDKPL